MGDAGHGFRNLQVVDHPLVRVKVARLRDRATPFGEFRRLVRELAGLLAFEATRGLPTREQPLETPLERTTGAVLVRPVTIVPILRAGLGLADGVLDLLPDAHVGHIGVFRNEASLEPVPYYAKFPPPMSQSDVLLVDPMLATGGSADHAATLLERKGCASVTLVCLICAPEGVRRMEERHPKIPIVTGALDRCLDAHGWIHPGLGDAGDRIFGTVG
jgi:uracil phosphoribosyltransferase